MGQPTIRGHQAKFRLFQDGGEIGPVIHLKSVDVNQESSFIKSYYVGAKTPVGDQSMDGWSGSAELEVGNKDMDDFIDALITDNLNGIGLSDYAFTVTDFFSDGTSQSYVYTDVQWKLGRAIRGSNEKVTQRLEFQAMSRQKVTSG